MMHELVVGSGILVHSKDPARFDVSRRFLCSYLDSLLCITHEPFADPCKSISAIVPVHTLSKPLKFKSDAVPLRWSLPLQGWSKLNYDGSFSPDDRVGSGMVLRDESGAVIFSSCRQLFSCRDALEAELGACMEGLSSLVTRDFASEMDSSVVVDALKFFDRLVIKATPILGSSPHFAFSIAFCYQ